VADQRALLSSPEIPRRRIPGQNPEGEFADDRRADGPEPRVAVVMRKAVRAKVCQHADVRELFLGTGDASIVEHSRWDAYWGDGGDGTGQNKLGRIFVEVRAELTKDDPFDELREILPPPWIKYPQIPRVSIGWRMGAGEGYMCEWGPWYGGLSEDGKRKYQAMFPAPAGEWADYWKDKSAKPKRPRKPR
jgi:hypothetical protein